VRRHVRIGSVREPMNVGFLCFLPWPEPYSVVPTSFSRRQGYWQMGLGVRRVALCKTVRELVRFGSAKCLNLQAQYRPLGSTIQMLVQLI
jgi:hypothetical protein